MKRALAIALVVALFGGLVLAGCGGPAANNAKDNNGKTGGNENAG